MEKKYVVYQHVTPDGMYYFGQTNNIKKRWGGNGRYYKKTSLYPYIEKFGWENIQHIVLFRDKTKEDALWIENFLIETAREDGVCINKNRSGNVSKEEGYNKNQMKYLREHNREDEIKKQKQYYEQNREKIKQYREQNREKIKQYREQNKDKILEYQREYKHKNRDKINERRRQHYQKNREKILEQQREYHQKNREKRLEYQREYYKRKKLEKQLKEIETTPLF